MSKILIVDDDLQLAEMLEDKLIAEQHTVESVHDGLEARDRIRLYEYDVIVLDWNLPGMEGVDICKEMRGAGNKTPVLMLTGKSAVDDRTEGLDSGADDYLTKPFHPKEFAARIRALVRRCAGGASNTLSVRDLHMDLSTHKVTKAGSELDLSPREFALLEFFMRYPDKVFNAEMLLNRVWSSEADSSPEAFRVCLARVRKRIDNADEESMIETVRGVGYRLRSTS